MDAISAINAGGVTIVAGGDVDLDGVDAEAAKAVAKQVMKDKKDVAFLVR